MRVLVTGAAGQLGRVIVDAWQGGADIVSMTRQQLDISQEDQVAAVVERERPSIIVNCSAYNAVDEAEERPQAAFEANAFGVLALARAAKQADAVLVHYGTDFVFDGDAEQPYTEADPPRPLSHYAISKLLGEWFAAEAPKHYVLRVESLFGGPHAKSSVDRILDGLVNGEPVTVFVDRVVSPSYVADVAAATSQLLDRRAPYGVYHCVNTGHTTWQGLAEEAARLLGVTAHLVPVPVAAVQLRARRPRYCALSNRKLADAGVVMPRWEDALARYIAARRGSQAIRSA